MRNLKKILMSAALVIGVSGVAQAKGSAKKHAKEEAKKACVAENPDLNGKALRQCVKQKLKGK